MWGNQNWQHKAPRTRPQPPEPQEPLSHLSGGQQLPSFSAVPLGQGCSVRWTHWYMPSLSCSRLKPSGQLRDATPTTAAETAGLHMPVGLGSGAGVGEAA